jgi:tetratricopeptide (TPR) repeat protein
MSSAVTLPRAARRREPTRADDMSEPSVQHGKSFGENIDILFDEILLAQQWGRPSLLLAVHKSKFGQDKAEKALEDRLGKEGFHVSRIVINDQRFDIPQLIEDSAPKSPAVFFISNIDWGGGEGGRQAYRGLNLHRELFVEKAIKAVFWLTVNEAANLPHFAPDFWAFRHRVVEFVSQRAVGKVQLPAGVLAWDMPRSPDPLESPEEAIRAREDLLRQLPESMEALSARIELHASIGHLHWTLGDLEPAARWFSAALDLAADHPLPEAKASVFNSMGILEYERGRPAEALERFRRGLEYQPTSRTLLINLSATQCLLGRIQEALTTSKKAVRVQPENADTWRRVGYIYGAAGRTDEAIRTLAKSAELAPISPDSQIALAVMYSLVDRPDEVKTHLRRARELAGDPSEPYGEILMRAALGKPDEAIDLLEKALDAGMLRKQDVRRDPNFALVFGDADLAEALA